MDNQFLNIRLLTLSEAAQLLHVSIRTLHRMIQSGDLPALKVGGQWRLRESQLQHWVEHRENSAVDVKKRSEEL